MNRRDRSRSARNTPKARPANSEHPDQHSSDNNSIYYGGKVAPIEFIAWPACGAISALALIPLVWNWLAWIFIAFGFIAEAALFLGITVGGFDENAWVEGSRVQLPLIIGSFVLGEMLIFASTYFRVSLICPESFSQRLTPASSVYFSVTAWTTTGFGDIHPQYAVAMLLVAAELIIAAVTVIVVLATVVSKAFANSRKN